MTDELEQMSPNQRRALDKALSALEAMAAIWAAEIRLGAMSARIAAVPSEAERAKRIAAMIEQGFIEGAYRHYLDHKDKCDAIEAARATADRDSADAWVSVDERFPDCNERHGYSAHVLVSITCGNGLQMVRSDRYDKHSRTWEKYHTDYGYNVSHWQLLPTPAAAIASPRSGDGESNG